MFRTWSSADVSVSPVSYHPHQSRNWNRIFGNSPHTTWVVVVSPSPDSSTHQEQQWTVWFPNALVACVLYKTAQQKTTATRPQSQETSNRHQNSKNTSAVFPCFSQFSRFHPIRSMVSHGLPSSSSLSKTWRKQIFPSSCAASGDNETRQPMTFRIRVPASKTLQQSAQLPKSQKKTAGTPKKTQ